MDNNINDNTDTSGINISKNYLKSKIYEYEAEKKHDKKTIEKLKGIIEKNLGNNNDKIIMNNINNNNMNSNINNDVLSESEKAFISLIKKSRDSERSMKQSEEKKSVQNGGKETSIKKSTEKKDVQTGGEKQGVKFENKKTSSFSSSLSSLSSSRSSDSYIETNIYNATETENGTNNMYNRLNKKAEETKKLLKGGQITRNEAINKMIFFMTFYDILDNGKYGKENKKTQSIYDILPKHLKKFD